MPASHGHGPSHGGRPGPVPVPRPPEAASHCARRRLPAWQAQCSVTAGNLKPEAAGGPGPGPCRALPCRQAASESAMGPGPQDLAGPCRAWLNFQPCRAGPTTSEWQLAAQAGRPRPLEPSTAAGTASGTEWSLVKFKFTGKFKFGSDESWPVWPDPPPTASRRLRTAGCH